MTQRTRRHPLFEHDPILKPVLSSASSTNPFNVALAVTVRGLSAGLTESTIRRWLVLRAKQRTVSVTSTSRRFHPVYVAAEAHLSASPDLAARRERAAASASVLVGLLLSPVKSCTVIDSNGERVAKPVLSAHQQAQARRVLAVVGAEIVKARLDDKSKGVLVHQPNLAVRLGVERRTTAAALKSCVKAGWLREVSHMPGGAVKYDLPARIPAASRETAWQFVDAINAVTDGLLDVDPVADLVHLADHRAWGHGSDSDAESVPGSRRDGKVWLAALASEAEVAPATLGLGRPAAKSSTASWFSILADHDADVPLFDILDSDARATGADRRAAEAQAKRRAESAARRIELERHRELRKQVFAFMEAALKQYPIPDVKADLAAQMEWLTAVVLVVTARVSVDAKVQVEFAKALESRMASKWHGYDRARARRVARRVAGLPDEVQASAA